MHILTLPASRRTATGKHSRQLLSRHRVPAVLYGHGATNINLDIDALQFSKIWKQAGSSSLVDLVVDAGSPVKVLIQAVQRHPLRHEVTHIDFYQVKMTEKLQADIELHFIGESAAIKEQGGILVRTLDTIKVECLPADLVPAIEVDISALKTFEDRIHVRDLKVPTGLMVMVGPDEVVASVTPPRSEAELESLKGEVTEDVTAVGTVEKPKTDEEEAEGEGTPAEGEKAQTKNS